ncbi:hypothetical protein ScPMuIL_017750 [Solemya velum]
MDVILENCPGCTGISDDVVHSRDEAEHDRNLLILMKKAREKGLVFNSAKCVIKEPDVSQLSPLTLVHMETFMDITSRLNQRGHPTVAGKAPKSSYQQANEEVLEVIDGEVECIEELPGGAAGHETEKDQFVESAYITKPE